jgi:flagellar basal body-associated protein FliL
MADEAVVEEEQEGGKGRGLLVPLLGVGLVMLLIGGAAGFFGSKMMGGDAPADGEPSADEAGADGAEPAAAIMPSTQVVMLGSFTINLRDSAGGRLLQMDLSVECDGEGANLVKSREAQLRDSIIMLASDYSYLELEGTDGRLRLRDEAHRRINAVLAPEKCSRVYFTKFVVQ